MEVGYWDSRCGHCNVVFDASEKLPSGLSLGNGGALGSFDQCLGVSENTSVGIINGKYCIGSIELVNLDGLNFNIQRYTPRFLHIPKNKMIIPWGICLPDGCAADDFQFVTLFLFKYYDDMCQTAQSQISTFDLGDYIAIAILSAIGFLVVVSTAFERFTRSKPESTPSDILNSFSLINNSRKITTVDRNKELTHLHGMRVISLLFLIYGFRYYIHILSPLDNWLDLYEWITYDKTSVYFEGILVVDTFFVISGFLVAHNYLKQMRNGVKFNVIFFYLARIVRLTPALFAVVLIHATLLRHIGSGPIWPNIRDTFMVNNCRENWWSTLLYVQTYVNSNNTCLLHTWHLGVEMQLFAASPIVLLPLATKPMMSFLILLTAFIVSIVGSFYVAWRDELYALFLPNLLPENFTNYLNAIFFGVYTRIPAWIVGCVTGYVLHIICQKSSAALRRKIFSPITILIFWVSATALIVTCIASPAFIGASYVKIKNSLHIALIRPAWSLGIAWVILACELGYSGPIKSILSVPIFQFISRISYCIFLSCFSIMMITTLQTRKGVEFGHFNVFQNFWADLALALVVGFILTVIFESPMIMLQKALYRRIENISPLRWYMKKMVVDHLKGNFWLAFYYFFVNFFFSD
ncbi:hypothetical protein RI129_006892 [Pyrocoelia pectoralis]|uniref:Nose resistant-to-fluoxetine protein N-terminal domain-containing protein n=1 Tax=Pyrocoelia pectoralis TaxID=417401 RepID=A0AAN7ZK53_9COLE